MDIRILTSVESLTWDRNPLGISKFTCLRSNMAFKMKVSEETRQTSQCWICVWRVCWRSGSGMGHWHKQDVEREFRRYFYNGEHTPSMNKDQWVLLTKVAPKENPSNYYSLTHSLSCELFGYEGKHGKAPTPKSSQFTWGGKHVSPWTSK